MSASNAASKVMCPFFRWRDTGKRAICCEGYMDGCSVTSTFDRKEDFLRQQEVFCEAGFRWCEVYRMARGKYDDE